MEQLTTNRQGRILELAMLTKKVNLKLSSSELKSLVMLMQHYFIHRPLICMDDKQRVFQIYMLYEKKIRPKQLQLKSKFMLRLDMSQASALFGMFRDMELEGYPYEQNLCYYITREIDHQTA